MTVFIDLDGVLADLTGALLRVHNMEDRYDEFTQVERMSDHPDLIGMSCEEWWAPATGVSFWRQKVQEYRWAAKMVMNLRAACKKAKRTLMFLSAPQLLDPQSASGKLWWVKDRWADEIPVVLTGQKHLLARPGRILIDDFRSNITAWEKEGGTAFVFPQPYNGHTGEPTLAAADAVTAAVTHYLEGVGCEQA